MPTCDLLLNNALVLTMDETCTVYRNGHVAITGAAITGVGPGAGDYDAAARVDCGGRTLLPGLVNAHTHAPMTLLRGLADDLKLDVWLMGYVMPVEREFVNPDFVRLGTGLACAEMIRSGITCFADMYYFEDGVAEAASAAGVRALCGQTVLKFPTPDAHSYEDSLGAARDFIAKWNGHPLIVPAPAPHAPYTCTPEILRACAELALEFGVPLHTHLSETALEVEQARKAWGMPVLPYVKKQGLLEAKVLAAHCVHVDDGEIRTLRNARAGVAHNPTSNLKLGSGVAPVMRMLDAGLNVGIGTDGPASNNDLDMFEEVRLAALLAKGMSGDPTALPARQALLMATRLGAQAMHMGDLTGSLVPGKRADLILVDLSNTHHVPNFERDPDAVYSRIVYTSKANDVTDVMCNGRWLMRERRLLTLDEAALQQAAREYATRIDAFLIEREESVLSKLVAIGGAVEEESFEVQIKARLDAPDAVVAALGSEDFTILRAVRYHQYDTWFYFTDPAQGRVRYREDEFLDENGEVTNVRARLTLVGPAREAQFGSVLLSRSRYLAPASHSRRFYREYFKPAAERDVEKARRRWQVVYRGVEFFVHLDELVSSQLPGCFLEIKSRTWSRRDAQDKARLIDELLERFGVATVQVVAEGYEDLALTT